MEQLTALGKADDPDSCLVMCEVRPGTIPDGFVPPGNYTPVSAGNGAYVPLADDQQWPTSYIVSSAKPLRKVARSPGGGRAHMFSHLFYNQVVAEDAPRPVYRPLAVAGIRRLYLPPSNPALPFTGGWRDCYTEWLPLDGEEFRKWDLIATGDYTRMYNIKHAAGALFSRTVAFDDNGKPSGFQTIVVVLEVNWYLGPPDNLKVDLYGHVYDHSDEHDKVPPPDLFYNVHLSWVDVMKRAAAGFEANCSSWPQYAEDTRTEFLAGQARDKRAGEAFTARIQGMAWIDAFDLVEDAKQLAIACQNLEPPEFAHRRTPNKRGRDMVARYAELRPERAELVQSLWPAARDILVQ